MPELLPARARLAEMWPARDAFHAECPGMVIMPNAVRRSRRIPAMIVLASTLLISDGWPGREETSTVASASETGAEDVGDSGSSATGSTPVGVTNAGMGPGQPGDHSGAEKGHKEPNEGERKRAAAWGMSYLLVGIALLGLLLLVIVMVWGRAVRVLARKPLPEPHRPDPLWYLRPKREQDQGPRELPRGKPDTTAESSGESPSP